MRPTLGARPRAGLRARRGASVATLTVAALACSSLAYGVWSGPGGKPGPLANGTAYTPTGWHVTPVGKQVTVGDRPFGLALSPDGRYALVSNDGMGTQSAQLVDVTTGAVTSQIDYLAPEGLFVGVAWSADGSRAYASGGNSDVVHVYDVASGTLTERAPLTLATKGTASPSFAAGLALSADGRTLWVADHLTNEVSAFDTASGKETRVKLSARTCAVNSKGYDTSLGADCEFTYGVALSPDGRRAFVSSWGRSQVTVIDTATKRITGRVRVGTHPSALLANKARNEVYVAATDNDTVAVLDASTGALTRTVSLSPYPGARPGTQPNALALAPDGGTLYVANAGNNDVDVVRLASGSTPDAVVGLIPTGWYPAAVAVTPDGAKVVVANAKGLGAGPNATPGGPSSDADYIGTMIKGTLSIIPTPTGARLAAYTKLVQANGGFPDLATQAGQHVVPASVPVAAGTTSARGPAGPIKHVIYIVNENRTYDQVLGDLGRGNGSPALTLFGRDVTPNHHRFAEQFVTLDNIYAAGEVSDDGWEWSTGANANSLDQKSEVANYGGRGHIYVGEGGTLAAASGVDPRNSYLWDRLDAAHLGYRNYGFWATATAPVEVWNEPNLDANTDHAYPGFNMSIPDQTRYAEWEKEFRAYEASGTLPAVEFLKFPRDHTAGTSPGQNTPSAMVADSDLALGKLVDTVSHSRYWKDTAIFVIEDDAQAGPDHVDAHRVLAHVISPYTQTGKVDSTFYSTVSMLRTIELILGIAPLTQFDASATPMSASFTDHPVFTPYTALQPKVDLGAVNPASAPLAKESAQMDFSREDRAPVRLLTRAIWESVKGAGAPMPR